MRDAMGSLRFRGLMPGVGQPPRVEGLPVVAIRVAGTASPLAVVGGASKRRVALRARIPDVPALRVPRHALIRTHVRGGRGLQAMLGAFVFVTEAKLPSRRILRRLELYELGHWQ